MAKTKQTHSEIFARKMLPSNSNIEQEDEEEYNANSNEENDASNDEENNDQQEQQSQQSSARTNSQGQPSPGKKLDHIMWGKQERSEIFARKMLRPASDDSEEEDNSNIEEEDEEEDDANSEEENDASNDEENNDQLEQQSQQSSARTNSQGPPSPGKKLDHIMGGKQKRKQPDIESEDSDSGPKNSATKKVRRFLASVEEDSDSPDDDEDSESEEDTEPPPLELNADLSFVLSLLVHAKFDGDLGDMGKGCQWHEHQTLEITSETNFRFVDRHRMNCHDSSRNIIYGTVNGSNSDTLITFYAFQSGADKSLNELTPEVLKKAIKVLSDDDPPPDATVQDLFKRLISNLPIDIFGSSNDLRKFAEEKLSPHSNSNFLWEKVWSDQSGIYNHLKDDLVFLRRYVIANLSRALGITLSPGDGQHRVIAVLSLLAKCIPKNLGEDNDRIQNFDVIAELRGRVNTAVIFPRGNELQKDQQCLQEMKDASATCQAISDSQVPHGPKSELVEFMRQVETHLIFDKDNFFPFLNNFEHPADRDALKKAVPEPIRETLGQIYTTSKGENEEEFESFLRQKEQRVLSALAEAWLYHLCLSIAQELNAHVGFRKLFELPPDTQTNDDIRTKRNNILFGGDGLKLYTALRSITMSDGSTGRYKACESVIQEYYTSDQASESYASVREKLLNKLKFENTEKPSHTPTIMFAIVQGFRFNALLSKTSHYESAVRYNIPTRRSCLAASDLQILSLLILLFTMPLKRRNDVLNKLICENPDMADQSDISDEKSYHGFITAVFNLTIGAVPAFTEDAFKNRPIPVKLVQVLHFLFEDAVSACSLLGEKPNRRSTFLHDIYMKTDDYDYSIHDPTTTSVAKSVIFNRTLLCRAVQSKGYQNTIPSVTAFSKMEPSSPLFFSILCNSRNLKDTLCRKSEIEEKRKKVYDILSKSNDTIDAAIGPFMEEMDLLRSSKLAGLIIRHDGGPTNVRDDKILKDVSKAISTTASKALKSIVSREYDSLNEKASLSMKDPIKSQNSLHEKASKYEECAKDICQFIIDLQREIPGVEPPVTALKHLRPIYDRASDTQVVHRDPNEVVRLNILTSQDETDQNEDVDTSSSMGPSADTGMCTFFNCNSSAELLQCKHCENGIFHHDCLDKAKSTDWPIISFVLYDDSCSKCLDKQLKGFCCNRRRRPNIWNSQDSYYQECDEVINIDGHDKLKHTCDVCRGRMHSQCRTDDLEHDLNDQRFSGYQSVCNYCCFVLGESESTRQSVFQNHLLDTSPDIDHLTDGSIQKSV